MFCPIVRGKETEKEGIRRNWLVSVRIDWRHDKETREKETSSDGVFLLVLEFILFSQLQHNILLFL